ncbi:MAG: alpha/beta hydrolase [Acidobacteriota bacterium]|nr:alpha/beta hydrolase [Acidobacteriota bacterium]
MPTDLLREIPGPAGRLEARLDLPSGAPRAIAVVAHPHPQFGGTMHTRAVHEAAKALTGIGVAALRFNFRGVGLSAGSFDEGMGEQEDFRAALDFAAARVPTLPILAAGMSFGSWVAMTVGAADRRVALLLAIAAPANRYDYKALHTSITPTFFIHGEEDEVTPLRFVRKLYGEVPAPKELVVIEGADHVFDGKASLVAEAVEDLLGDFDIGWEHNAS